MSYQLDIQKLSLLINGKTILITGSTGSFGKMMIQTLLKYFTPKKIIVYSRDEYKQFIMSQKFNHSCIRYFIGDIRDYDRLSDALNGVDIVFHAAALKHVGSIEYNPMEAIKTNINGSQNVIRACIQNKVKRVIAISTDKCVNPVNLYGATKLCSERLFINGNILSGKNGTIFSVLRYGNVLGSRGSVLPLFLKQKRNKVLTITSEEMTRFTITLENAINFVLMAFIDMIGGEVFIPKLPSYNIMQLAKIIGEDKCTTKIIGIRPGEKIHEKMISEDESHLALECQNFFVIQPSCYNLFSQNYTEHYKKYGAKEFKSNCAYSSGENEYIDDELLREMINEYESL